MRASRIAFLGAAAMWSAVQIVSIVPAGAAQQQAPAGDRTIWSGVYTAAQAARGKPRFETSCIRCHNIALTGSERGPALKGNTFWSKWENDNLGSMYIKVRDTMPQDGGASVVSDEVKVDILAYILQASGAPAGNEELKLDTAQLEGIKISKRGIWDGVFTAAQAERGKSTYLTGRCGGCHQLDLVGGDRAPALKGDGFLSHWENGSVTSLFAKIRDTMPPNSPNDTTEDAKLDVVAYLLQSNGFPAGAGELRADVEALDQIEIVRKVQGSKAPNFALVQVVGCLSQAPDSAWVLTNTGEPVVTKQEEPTPANLKDAEAKGLGDLTFQLVSVNPFKPESHKGHKMEARGLLYRDPTDARLNLTSLQMVGPTCGQ
jgi:mono/diheme cytochrome c family protein